MPGKNPVKVLSRGSAWQADPTKAKLCVDLEDLPSSGRFKGVGDSVGQKETQMEG